MGDPSDRQARSQSQEVVDTYQWVFGYRSNESYYGIGGVLEGTEWMGEAYLQSSGFRSSEDILLSHKHIVINQHFFWFYLLCLCFSFHITYITNHLYLHYKKSTL